MGVFAMYNDIFPVLTATLLGSTALMPVHAQVLAEPVDQPEKPADTNASRGLAEIVVTARKKDESLIDVPLAVTALDAEALEAKGIEDLNDVASFSPGFTNQTQSVGRNDRGFSQFVIRGVVPNSALPQRQSVTIFVDGAPVTGGTVAGVTDIERVEVVKGPQSAFFGKSTFGGAVNIITRAPSYDWGGRAAISYERFNSFDATGSIEGPIVEGRLAFRLSGRAYHTDGQYEDSVNTGERLGERDTKSISLSLLAEPTDNLSIRLFGVTWNDSDGQPANSIFGAEQYNCNTGIAPAGTNNFICGPLNNVPVNRRTRDQRLFPEAIQSINDNSELLNGEGFIDHLGLERKAKQVRGIADWRIGDYTLSAITAYGKDKWNFLQTNLGQDITSIPNPLFTPGSGLLPTAYTLVYGEVQNEDYYGELRLASPQDRRLHWLIGVNYLNAKNRIKASIFGNPGFIVATPISEFGSESYAVFGSVGFDISDKLSASLEGRYQVNKESQTSIGANTATFEETETTFIPRIIVEYKPTSDSTLYASYSEGTRPLEFNGLFFAQSQFVQDQITQQANIQGVVPEDKIRMGEFGVKGQFFDNRLRVLAAVYYGEWTNRHIQNLVPVFQTPAAQQAGQRTFTSLTGSDGEVDLKGLELELSLQATPQLLLESTFNIADTKIKRTACSDCRALTGNDNPVGNELPFFPKYSGTISGTYSQPIGAVDGFVRVDGIYTGRQYITESNLAYTPDAFKVNLRVGATFDGKRIEFFGTNIFDNKAPTSGARAPYTLLSPTGAPSSFEGITVSLADRASYGVRASIEF